MSAAHHNNNQQQQQQQQPHSVQVVVTVSQSSPHGHIDSSVLWRQCFLFLVMDFYISMYIAPLHPFKCKLLVKAYVNKR